MAGRDPVTSDWSTIFRAAAVRDGKPTAEWMRDCDRTAVTAAASVLPYTRPSPPRPDPPEGSTALSFSDQPARSTEP